MSLLLWEAPGPGRSTCGVSTDRARAERAVGDCLISGQATTAFVQEAELVTGSSALARDLLHAMRSDFVGGGLTGFWFPQVGASQQSEVVALGLAEAALVVTS